MTMQIKRRMSGAAGAPSSLKSGQFAWNNTDQTLYFGDGDDGSGNATSIKAIAGSGAAAMLTGTQTIAGSKTFSTVPDVGTMTSSDNTTKAASTAFVKAQGYITGNQSITFTGDVTGSGTTSVGLTLATVNTNVGTFCKVTVNGKGLVTAATNLSASDIPSLTSAKISDFDTQVRSSRLDQMASPSASVSMNSQKLTNLADAVAATDAVTLQQLQAVQTGLDVKASVRVATTANITLSGTQTIDGVSVAAGDRVLVKNQTTGTQNGIYVCAAGSWSRSTDADTAGATGEVTGGMFCFVEEGTANADTGWILTNDGTITLGSTSLVFTQFSGAGSFSVTAPLAKSGNTLSLNLGSEFTTSGGNLVAAGRLAAITTASAPGAGTSNFPYLDSSGVLQFYNSTNSVWLSSLLIQTSMGAVRTAMGLDTMATQNAGSVNITGGTIGSSVTMDDGTF